MNGKQSTLRRPISCLHPLEVDPKVNLQKTIPDAEATAAEQSQESAGHTRLVRAAAVKARQCVGNWISELTDSI